MRAIYVPRAVILLLLTLMPRLWAATAPTQAYVALIQKIEKINTARVDCAKPLEDLKKKLAEDKKLLRSNVYAYLFQTIGAVGFTRSILLFPNSAPPKRSIAALETMHRTLSPEALGYLRYGLFSLGFIMSCYFGWKFFTHARPKEWVPHQEAKRDSGVDWSKDNKSVSDRARHVSDRARQKGQLYEKVAQCAEYKPALGNLRTQQAQTQQEEQKEGSQLHGIGMPAMGRQRSCIDDGLIQIGLMSRQEQDDARSAIAKSYRNLELFSAEVAEVAGEVLVIGEAPAFSMRLTQEYTRLLKSLHEKQILLRNTIEAQAQLIAQMQAALKDLSESAEE